MKERSFSTGQRNRLGSQDLEESKTAGVNGNPFDKSLDHDPQDVRGRQSLMGMQGRFSNPELAGDKVDNTHTVSSELGGDNEYQVITGSHARNFMVNDHRLNSQ